MENSRLEVEFAQLSDTGRVRGHNEDYLGYVVPTSAVQARSHGWLFALADGVGGQAKGEVASRLAVECLLDGFRRATAGEPHSVLMPRLAQAANNRVVEAGHAEGSPGPAMATTLVACALRFDRAAVAHVGDSRCYLIRAGEANLLTRDHTIAHEHVRIGLISQQEATDAQTRHLLSRSLGSELFVNVEVSDHAVLPGDVLLLCSDGLHGALDATDLARVAGGSVDLNAAARELVALANERDGSDNVSVQLVRIRSIERVGFYRGRPYKLR